MVDGTDLYGEKAPGEVVFFISDVHLGSDDTELEEMKRKTLFSFFSMVLNEGSELYILGDLFDFWFEYDHVVPGIHAGLISWLWRLRQKGITIHYIVGNHDYWAGRFFEEELGISVLKEPIITNLDGRQAFITHGDGLGKGDLGYKLLKTVLRNRFTIFLFGLLHPRLGFLLARLTSAISKRDYERKSQKASRALRAYALNRLEDDDIELFITGHTHRPELLKVRNKYFLNTGDWIRHLTYAVMRNGEIKLMQWGDRIEELATTAIDSRKASQ
ncbi:MAG: UDP-2,3-diacylglucosamine diphosphatase [Candidatus Glassbacteria bacterium]